MIVTTAMVVKFSMIVFIAVIFFLVTIILVAERRLVPQGNVKILINGDENKSPTVKPGGTLLSVLSNQSVFLPSACGGGGTCAMCKCQIYSGGGDILPTELTHISRSEAKKNWRLACQVKVRDNMEIRIEAAKAWSIWEASTSKLIQTEKTLHSFDEDHVAEAFARIECCLNKNSLSLSTNKLGSKDAFVSSNL